MDRFHTHVTSEGDRWDLLAYYFYGNAHQMEPIIQANPDIPITPVLAPGLVLLIPILETPVEESVRPPWKTS